MISRPEYPRLVAGDGQTAAELLPVLYQELRRLARQRMFREPSSHTLQPTALVHEAYLRLLGGRSEDDPVWNGRGHFFAAAAEAMRRILIERARRRNRPRHGGGRRRVALTLDLAKDDATARNDDELLALDDALAELESRDSRKARVVKLRVFAGLTVEQIADALGVTGRTVDREWAAARAYLVRSLQRGHDSGNKGNAP